MYHNIKVLRGLDEHEEANKGPSWHGTSMQTPPIHISKNFQIIMRSAKKWSMNEGRCSLFDLEHDPIACR